MIHTSVPHEECEQNKSRFGALSKAKWIKFLGGVWVPDKVVVDALSFVSHGNCPPKDPRFKCCFMYKNSFSDKKSNLVEVQVDVKGI